MNILLKNLIKEKLDNKDNVIIKKYFVGTVAYNLYDQNDKLILTVNNRWDRGIYDLNINNKTVTSVKWRETYDKKMPVEVQDVFFLIEECDKKYEKQQQDKNSRGTMSSNEYDAYVFLKQQGQNQR